MQSFFQRFFQQKPWTQVTIILKFFVVCMYFAVGLMLFLYSPMEQFIQQDILRYFVGIAIIAYAIYRLVRLRRNYLDKV